jgi:hypothetical protein
MNVFIMQINYVKISCKEDVHICRTNFTKQMEWNSHERTNQWKMYGKRLFFEDLEVRDVVISKSFMKVLFLFYHVTIFINRQ